MRMKYVLTVAVVLALDVVCASGCEDAKIYSPTGSPVVDGGSCGGDGNCTAGNVTCGSLTCFGGEQFCSVTVAGCSDAGGAMGQKSYACPALPVTCGTGSGCSCLGTLAAGCSCTEESGTPVLTCCAADAGVFDASSEAPSDAAADGG